MKSLKQLVLFTIILLAHLGTKGQLNERGQIIPRYDGTSNNVTNSVNIRDFNPIGSEYVSYFSEIQSPFMGELPSNETWNNGLISPFDLSGQGSTNSLDDNPNGQGPGIGTRAPIPSAFGFMSLIIIAYGLILYIRIRNKRRLSA